MCIKTYYKSPLNLPLKLHILSLQMCHYYSGISKNTVERLTMYIGASYYVRIHCKEVVPFSEIDKYYHYVIIGALKCP